MSLKIDELDEDVQKLRRRKIFDNIFVKKYEPCHKIKKRDQINGFGQNFVIFKNEKVLVIILFF